MVEIIPAIIAKSFMEVREMVGMVEQNVRWVQLDIMDNNFVPNLTWNNPDDLKSYNPGVFLEAHLMISDPEKYVDRWISGGVKRIVFHFEATENPHEIIQICRQRNTDVGIALNPETDTEVLKPFDELVDMVLMLGVTPGFGGQKFKPKVLEKVKQLRGRNSHLTIGIDGGMNPRTAKKAVEAGANIIVTGSYIFGSNNAEKAINDMKESVK